MSGGVLDVLAAAHPPAFPFDGASEAVSLSPHAPVFHIQDRRGGWVLKRTGMARSAAGPIDRWLRAIAARGVRTVIAADGFGQNPRVLEDGAAWVVYPFIPGASYTADPAQIEAAGALLGHMHAAGAFNDWGLARMPRSPQRPWSWVEAHAATGAAAVGAAGGDAEAFLACVAERWSPARPPGGLPTAGGSADFKAANLVFTPSPMLIDPDHAAHLPRIHDLAIAALLFHSDCPTAPARVWTAPDWQAFLAGYTRIIRFTPAEHAAWPETLCRAWLDQAVWLLGNFPSGWNNPAEAARLLDLATLDLERFSLPPTLIAV